MDWPAFSDSCAVNKDLLGKLCPGPWEGAETATVPKRSHTHLHLTWTHAANWHTEELPSDVTSLIMRCGDPNKTLTAVFLTLGPRALLLKLTDLYMKIGLKMTLSCLFLLTFAIFQRPWPLNVQACFTLVPDPEYPSSTMKIHHRNMKLWHHLHHEQLLTESFHHDRFFPKETTC